MAKTNRLSVRVTDEEMQALSRARDAWYPGLTISQMLREHLFVVNLDGVPEVRATLSQEIPDDPA